MIGLVWEWEIFGTLSLDFPVLAEEEIVWGTKPQKGLPGAWAQGRLWPCPQQQVTALWSVCTFMSKGGKHYMAWLRKADP